MKEWLRKTIYDPVTKRFIHASKCHVHPKQTLIYCGEKIKNKNLWREDGTCPFNVGPSYHTEAEFSNRWIVHPLIGNKTWGLGRS